MCLPHHVAIAECIIALNCIFARYVAFIRILAKCVRVRGMASGVHYVGAFGAIRHNCIVAYLIPCYWGIVVFCEWMKLEGFVLPKMAPKTIFGLFVTWQKE